MKQKTIWIVVAIVVAVALFALPGLFYGRGGMMSGYGYRMGSNFMDQSSGSWADCGSGYGMMGGGWGLFGWLFPVVTLLLVVAGGVWLGNALSNRSKTSPVAPPPACPNCNKPVAADWTTCPYCGTSLE